jgi:large subunit ribosomal protein L21
MKKAVISVGPKQYLVIENQELDVDHLSTTSKTTEFEPLLVIDDDQVLIGKPKLSTNKVTATITEPAKKAEKTVSVRYKAKKRVHKVRGHRQLLSTIKITKIS